MSELDDVKAVFLADDVDEEARADNEAQIREWEQSLQESEALQSWQEHDMTKQLIAKATESYRDFAILLAENRTLTQEQRMSLWAKQDAIKWFIELGGGDAKGTIEAIKQRIRQALAVK